MSVKFQTEMLSRSGGRDYNEDYCMYGVAETEKGRYRCWIVADGLGGHGGGEVASQTFVDTAVAEFKKNPDLSHEALMYYAEKGQEKILQKQKEDSRLARMRTTFVMLVADGKSFSYAHVGDSRLYLLRNGATERPLSNDHSVPWAFMKSGEIRYKEIRRHADRNRLLRAAGNEDDFRPDINKYSIELINGDAFLLCTDGFWDYVDEIGMMADYAKANTSKEWLVHMERRLLGVLDEKRIKNNDNYTAMAIFTE